MLASLTIFFFCAGNPGNESPTYAGFEVYYIKKKKVFAMVKKLLLWVHDRFFSYINKHVHFTLVLQFGGKYKPKQNGILFWRAEQQIPFMFYFLGFCHYVFLCKNQSKMQKKMFFHWNRTNKIDIFIWFQTSGRRLLNK